MGTLLFGRFRMDQAAQASIWAQLDAREVA